MHKIKDANITTYFFAYLVKQKTTYKCLALIFSNHNHFPFSFIIIDNQTPFERKQGDKKEDHKQIFL